MPVAGVWAVDMNRGQARSASTPEVVSPGPAASRAFSELQLWEGPGGHCRVRSAVERDLCLSVGDASEHWCRCPQRPGPFGHQLASTASALGSVLGPLTLAWAPAPAPACGPCLGPGVSGTVQTAACLPL